MIISNKYSKNLGKMGVMSTITERMEKKKKEKRNSASDRKRKGTFSNVFIGSYTTVSFVWPIWDQIGLFVSRELKRDQHFFPKQTNKGVEGFKNHKQRHSAVFTVQCTHADTIIEPTGLIRPNVKAVMKSCCLASLQWTSLQTYGQLGISPKLHLILRI